MKNKYYRSFISMALMLITLMAVIGCSAAPDIPDPESFKSYVRPSQPKNLTATQGLHTDSDGRSAIEVTWDNSGDADYYKLYIANAADGNFSTPFQLPATASSYYDYAADGLVKLYYLEAIKSFSLSNGTTTLTSEPSETAVGSSTPSIEFYVRSGTRTNTVNWVVRGADYDSSPLFDNMSCELYRNGEVINTVDMAGATGFSYKDEVSPDSSYIYQIRLLYGNEGEELRTVTSSEISVETGLDYNPEAALDITATDNTYYIDNGILKADMITLGWTTRVHDSVLSDPNASLEADSSDIMNAHPYFLIERSIKGQGKWETALAYADNDSSASAGSLEKSVSQEDSYYIFNMAFSDYGLSSGTEYEYRITTRYYFSDNWYTEQENESEAAADTGSTLSFPLDFTLTADSSVVTREDGTGKDVSAVLTWRENTLPEELFAVIEKRDVLDASSSWTAIDAVPVNEDSLWTVTDEFTLLTSELDTSKNYSYRISIQSRDGGISSPVYYTVPAPLLVNGMKSIFDVVDITSFSVSDDLASSVELNWSTDLTAGASAGIELLDRSLIRYTLKNSNEETVASGLADEAVFTVTENTDNTISVRYTDLNFTEGTSYYLVAEYLEADGSTKSETTTSVLTGRILAPASGLTAAIGQTESIPVSFTGADKAVSYNLYYRNKGTDVWILAGNILNSGNSSESYSFTIGSDNPLSEKGNRIEFAVTNIDRQGSESDISASTIAEGSYFGLATFTVTASESIVNNRPNFDKISLTWTRPDGAESFNVYRSETENGRYSIVGTSFEYGSDNLSGEDKFTENDKLIGSYYYKVLPSSATVDASLDDVKAVKGSFFAPPVNIVATKGTYYNGIRISWEPVDNAAGYILYRREAGSDASWTEVNNNIAADATSVVDEGLTAAIDYEYTLATKFDNANHSMLQNSQAITEGTNAGYPLVDINPDSVTLTYDGNGNMTITLDSVRGATAYEFVQGNVLFQNFDASDADKVTATVPVYGNSKFLLGEGFALRASNSEAVTSAVSVTDKYTGEMKVSSFADMIKSINTALAVDITAANSQFERDWWSPNSGWFGSTSSDVRHYNSTGIEIKNAKGGGSYTGQSQEPGYIKLTDYSVSVIDISLNSLQNTAVYANETSESSSGYRGIDPLQYVGYHFNDSNTYGKIAITINPEVTGQQTLSLRYRDVNVDSAGGSYEILLGDDIVSSIADSADFPRLLNK